MPSSYCLFLSLLLAASASAYKHYQNKLPNGDKVEHPCQANEIWQGIGHHNNEGGGSRNAFGDHFAAAGHKWTNALCKQDSDTDGRTNGEELGDPKCVWKEGDTPSQTKGISHPGVCQPLDSAKCKAFNGAALDTCKSVKLVCPALNSPGVFNITLRFTRTNVPKQVTNYFCQGFELAADKDYHMIADEAVVDNAEVVHHALVFGCMKRPPERFMKGPSRCEMSGYHCFHFIAVWALGSTGECLPPQYGILFGKHGFKYLLVQFHWNNVDMRDDHWDQSAMRLYLTPTLRPNHGSLLMVGQRYLEIPARQTSVTQQATCSSDCTSHRLKGTMYLADIFAHMHYAGTHAEAYQYRNGKQIRVLLPYSRVIFDQPKKIIFTPAVKLEPGDEIKAKCHFKTTTKTDMLYYGYSTQDEMCFFFFNTYPNQKFYTCLNYGSIDMCSTSLPKNGARHGMPGNIGNNCNVADFIQTRLPTTWLPLIREFCDYSTSVCRPACRNIVNRMNKEEPCWTGNQKQYLNYIMIRFKDVPKANSTEKLFSEVSEARWRLSLCSEDTTSSASPPQFRDDMQKTQAVLIEVGCAMIAVSWSSSLQ